MAGTFIHPTAQVDTSAVLGLGVSVGPYAIIGPDVSVGDDTAVAPHAIIECNTVIGKCCRIYTGAAVGIDPQDLKYSGEATWLEIGDSAVLREYSTVSRGSTRSTVIGSGFILMGQAQISHDCQIGDNVIISSAANILDHAVIGDHAMVGGLTFVNRHCRIGRLAFVGGGFRVARDVPPFVIAGDEPLQISAVNTVALQKKGYDSRRTAGITAAYKILHALRDDPEAALARIKAELEPSEEIGEIVNFYEVSEKGVI